MMKNKESLGKGNWSLLRFTSTMGPATRKSTIYPSELPMIYTKSNKNNQNTKERCTLASFGLNNFRNMCLELPSSLQFVL